MLGTFSFMSPASSQKLFDRARQKIPGGVNSPVRAWKAVGGAPRFIDRGEGATVVDAEGSAYVDYLASWGALILGHAHPDVVNALQQTIARGTTFGAPTQGEVELAEAVCARVPSIEKLRLVSSGTEAAMSAIRLSRAFTKRSKIVKFDGCYHGHVDGMLVRSGSGIATFSLPDSAGVPPAYAAETLVAAFNDLDSVEVLFRRAGDDIAAVIVEPVCGNMGVIPPAPGFLAKLKEMAQRYDALLIFDEVITGFRLASGGAQQVYNVTPDLTCLGKILGGGLPLAAFGGRAEIMDLLAPEGPVYQAGTLSGNPLAVAAGLATLRALSKTNVYGTLEERGKELQEGFETIAKQYGIQTVINRVGSMLMLFFGTERVHDADEARLCDKSRFARFFHGMLARGIYWPPSPFESAFISRVHGKTELDKTLRAFEDWAREETKG